MKNRMLVALGAVIVVTAVAVGVRMVIWDGAARAPQAILPAIGGPFTLLDEDGNTITGEAFQGRYRLMSFGYTFCPDVCPTALGTMASAYDMLPPAQRQMLVPIFVTVDPTRDTPKVLKDYVAAFHPAMRGLTGSEEQIAAVAKAFKVYAAKVKSEKEGAYTMDHSAILYLMGPDGRFVAHFPNGTSAADLAAGLKKQLP